MVSSMTSSSDLVGADETLASELPTDVDSDASTILPEDEIEDGNTSSPISSNCQTVVVESLPSAPQKSSLMLRTSRAPTVVTKSARSDLITNPSIFRTALMQIGKRPSAPPATAALPSAHSKPAPVAAMSNAPLPTPVSDKMEMRKRRFGGSGTEMPSEVDETENSDAVEAKRHRQGTCEKRAAILKRVGGQGNNKSRNF
jgi:hypothetical protein